MPVGMDLPVPKLSDEVQEALLVDAIIANFENKKECYFVELLVSARLYDYQIRQPRFLRVLNHLLQERVLVMQGPRYRLHPSFKDRRKRATQESP